MRIPPCRICHKAYVKQNFGMLDFVVCESCYDDILEKNNGKYRYARLTIEEYRNFWGAADPNSKAQRKYVRAMNRRKRFAAFVAASTLIGLCVFCGCLFF